MKIYKRTKIGHVAFFKKRICAIFISTKGQRKTSDVKEEREKKTKNIIERKNKVGDI